MTLRRATRMQTGSLEIATIEMTIEMIIETTIEMTIEMAKILRHSSKTIIEINYWNDYLNGEVNYWNGFGPPVAACEELGTRISMTWLTSVMKSWCHCKDSSAWELGVKKTFCFMACGGPCWIGGQILSLVGETGGGADWWAPSSPTYRKKSVHVR